MPRFGPKLLELVLQVLVGSGCTGGSRAQLIDSAPQREAQSGQQGEAR